MDGAFHAEQKEQDRERSAYFESIGFRVLRFTNDEVRLRLHDVLQEIERSLEETPPRAAPPLPFETGEGVGG